MSFDMSEYMGKIRSYTSPWVTPPGWATRKEAKVDQRKIRNKHIPFSYLLEVEKHPDIFNVLTVQVLDDGVLTDSKGRKIDFSNLDLKPGSWPPSGMIRQLALRPSALAKPIWRKTCLKS